MSAMARFQIFFIVFAIIAPMDVGAARPATQDEYKAIQEHLNKAKRIRDIEIPHQRDLLYGEKDPAIRHKIQGAIDNLNKDVLVERDKAIHLALAAYDILPVDSSGKPVTVVGKSVVPDEFNGRTMSWIPASADRQPRMVARNDGSNELIRPPTKLEAISVTHTDGISSIFEESFESPAQLASTLLHELTHFQQYITGGKGDFMTPAEREVEAYRIEALNIDNLGFMGTEREFWAGRLQKKMIEKGEIALKERKFVEDRHLPYLRGSPFLKPHTDDEIDSAFKQSNDLNKIVAEELETVHRERERMESNRLLEYMQNIAAFSCYNPGKLDQDSLDHLPRVDPGNCMAGWPAGRSCTKDTFQWICKKIRDKEPLILEGLAEAQRLQEDDRLAYYKENLARIVKRSCASPGSVGQDELQSLDHFSDPNSRLSFVPMPVDGDRCFPQLYNDALAKLHGGYVLEPDWFYYWGNQYMYRPGPQLVRVKPYLGWELANLATKACADPSAITVADKDRLREADFPSRDPIGAKDAARGLSGCAKELLEEFIEFSNTWSEGESINIAWLQKEAARLIEKNKTPPVYGQPAPDQKERRGKGDGGPCGDGGSGCGRPRPTMPGH